MELFRPDKPIEFQADDKFQRYSFAKRIAEIVSKGYYSSSLVVGIYGKWGEGKTSVMNFIKNEVDGNTIVIPFNPWLFTDENQLLKAFFEAFASAVGRKLITNKKRAAEAFANYADSVGALMDIKFPGASVLFGFSKKIIKIFKNDSTEVFKQKVDNLIIEANTNFVVFIDDIDRLDINEVQSVFKLVKLVGDFPRTSYILSFDDDMVASALGPKYANRDKSSGYDFLEKIIQIPLHLPKADKQALRKYTLNLVDKVINDIKISLSKKEVGDFVSKFDEAFLPALLNPRLGVRFANSIGFSIPLLLGEVNISDLLTIEGIKIFYPELYHFIRSNSDYFLKTYSGLHSFNNNTEVDKKENKQAIDDALKIYEEGIRQKILLMLMSLFPQLKTIYQNYLYRNETYQGWYREKRLCSPHYFERYFSYVVRDDDISDLLFTDLLSGLDKISPEVLKERLSGELMKLKPDDFLFKLQQYVPAYNTSEAITLSKVLAQLGNYFSDKREILSFSAKEQAAYIIHTLLLKLTAAARLKTCLEVLHLAMPFEFMMDIHYRFKLKPEYEWETDFLNVEEQKEISEFIVKRFEEETNEENLLKALPDYEIRRILYLYDEIAAKEKAEIFLKNLLKATPLNSLAVIKIFTPTLSSSSNLEPHKTNFTQEDFEDLKRFINPQIVYEASVSSFGNIDYVGVGDRQHYPLTDENLIAKFQKMYLENSIKVTTQVV